MAGFQANDYQTLHDASDGSDSSDEISASPLLNLLKEHGYTVQKKLGRGVSGTSYLVTNADEDPYVVKQMNSRDREELLKVQQQVNILKKMNHGYIVSYVDSFEDKASGLFYIVMEYCARGDLYKRMQTQKENGPFHEQQIVDWFVQICLALQYLHDERRNILHRDIKPQNIFLTEDDYINLGDFGHSKVLQRAYAQSVVGSDLYISPEVRKRRYDSKSDIWSLGWVLYDLCMLDVWSDIDERRIQQAYHNKGKPLHISNSYSKDLQKLIKEMLTRDPTDRPSAEEILAKPFLREAVNRNKRIPEELERRFMMSIGTFDETYREHYKDFETLVKEWGETTNSLEEIHRKCTIGTLTGSVIGTAGGVTALVGAILAPFTFGASLIVTGVGIGVGVAGGVTGAASSITNTVKQKALRNNIEAIQQQFNTVCSPILDSLNTLRRILKIIKKFRDFVGDSSDNVGMLNNDLDERRVVCAAELVNLGLLANVGRIAAQTARVGRAAAEAVAAVSGVLSGLLVILDVAFVVMDSADMHQMNQGRVDDPKKVKSSLLKSIAQMRKTHTDLLNVLKEIKETREALRERIEMVRRGRHLLRDLESVNV